jgi:hypothetical protein
MFSKPAEQKLEKHTSWFDLIGKPIEEDSYFLWIRGLDFINRVDRYFKIFFLPFLFIALVLGYIGYFQAGFGNVQSIYMTIRMFLLTINVLDFSNDFVKYGNYLAFLVKLYILLKLILTILNELVKSIRIGRSNRHIVICGLSNKGFQLVHDFREKKENVLVIEKDEKNELITDAERLGAYVILGDATDKELLMKSRVFSAKYVIIVSNDDSVNISIALATYSICVTYKRKLRQSQKADFEKSTFLPSIKKMKNKTQCVVHIQNLELIDLLEHHQIFTDQNPLFELNLFNTYENIARYLYIKYPPYLLTDTNSQESPPIHFLIVGFNFLSESIIVQNAQIGHYANQTKTHLTIIDSDIESKKINFFQRYPRIEELCEFNFLDEAIENVEISQNTITTDEKRIPITSAVVCENNDMKCLSTSLLLLKKIKDEEIFIFMYLMHDIGLSLFLNKEFADYSRLIPFGMIETISTKEFVIGEKLNSLAKTIHSNYVESMIKTFQDDSYQDIMQPWELLTNEIKDSNKKQADHILVKIHIIGAKIQKQTNSDSSNFSFSQEEIELLARIEHNRWLTNRYLGGWTFGNERNSKEKITPDLIEYDSLDEDAKEKDRNTITNIPKYLRDLNLEIVRET